VSDRRYPLSWPAGWPRTRWRQTAQFGTGIGGGRKRAATVAEAIGRLQAQLDLLNASEVVLSTNLELRLDGMPRSDRSPPADPGVAIYFKLKGRDIALACDKWDRVADNVIALAKHIEAMRGMDRWGVGSVEQAFRGYEALPAPEPWWRVLGLAGPTRSRDEINRAYRAASANAHPDRPGGSHDGQARVNAARDEGLRQLTNLAKEMPYVAQ
jgi:hypothetical protein